MQQQAGGILSSEHTSVRLLLLPDELEPVAEFYLEQFPACHGTYHCYPFIRGIRWLSLLENPWIC